MDGIGSLSDRKPKWGFMGRLQHILTIEIRVNDLGEGSRETTENVSPLFGEQCWKGQQESDWE